MEASFWKDKKVVITGAAGFIGSHLTQKLLKEGALVVGIVRGDLKSSILELHGLGQITNQENFILENNNLLDAAFLEVIFDKHKPDTVFHLAASAIVSEAAKNPSPTISSNVVGTLNILEASRLAGVKRVLIASSDKTYGDHSLDPSQPLPFKEDYSLRGLDIYSASKTCADMLAQAYAFQYKMPVAILRSCNVFGPGDTNVTRLIPKTILRLMTGKKPQIKLGHEKVLREYIYIDDVLEAYLVMAQKVENYYGEEGQNIPVKGSEPFGWPAFNVGSYTAEQTKDLGTCENIQNVSNVISLLAEKINGLQPEVVEKNPEYIEIPDEYSDSSKILNLGFVPKVGFKQGIDKTIAWYKEHFADLKNLEV